MSDPDPTPAGRETGDPNAPVTLAVAIASAILLVVIVVLLEAYFFKAESEENQRKVVAVVPEELAQARADQIGLIHAYRWIDEKQGVVGIPIERAMELVVAEQGRVAAAAPAAVPATGKGR
jgi:hypothetical protein